MLTDKYWCFIFVEIIEWHALRSGEVDYLNHYYFYWIFIIIWIFQNHHLASAVLSLLSTLAKKTDSQVTCLYKITFSLPRLLFHSNVLLKKNKAVWATDTCLWPLHSSTTEIVSWCLFKSWIKLLPFLSAWLLLFIDKVK